MPLNKDNFLYWTGPFEPIAYELDGTPVPMTLYSNEEFTLEDVLSSLTSSNGIDFNSFKFINITDFTGGVDGAEIILASPPQWSPEEESLTTYRPTDFLITAYKIHFTISDVLGNSYTTFVEVTVDNIVIAWVPYPSSATCILNPFGQNNGYKLYWQLMKVNMATGVPLSPLQLKPNDIGDADYYPPEQDFTSCPPPGAGSGLLSPLIISNFSRNAGDPNNYITINNIYLASSNMGPGGTPFTSSIPCDIPPGQSARFMLPSTSVGFTYDAGISINFIVTGDMVTAPIQRYWKQNNAGVVTGFGPGGVGLTANPVDNSGVIGVGSFVLPNPNGVTIFAQ